MNNIDVLKELKNKNKEIYLNKLIVDIENNSEILEITINNIIELLTTEMIYKLNEICQLDFSNVICENVQTFQNKINSELIRLIKEREKNLKGKISIDDDFNYKNELDNEMSLLISEISTFYKNNVQDIIKKLANKLDSFSRERLSEFFNVLYYDKLINKIKEILSNKNMILYNNYQAGLIKYQNMNEKTLNLV